MWRSKRRSKKFYGTPSWKKKPVGSTSHSSVVEVQAEATVERPTPVETASSKKLAISSLCLSSGEPSTSGGDLQAPQLSASSGESSSVGELTGYRLIRCERLSRVVGKIGLCVACGSPLTLREDLVTRKGMVSKLMICCTNTACNKEAAISGPSWGCGVLGEGDPA